MAQIIQLPLPLLGVSGPPAPIRRRVYRVRLSPSADGTYTFRSHSFTSRRGPVYRIAVNARTGCATCTCPDYKYRHAYGTNPGTGVCKHIRRAFRTVRQAEQNRHPALKLAA